MNFCPKSAKNSVYSPKCPGGGVLGEHFEETLKELVKVPKEEVDEKRREWEREKKERRVA
jgi:hypothetical protein